VIVVDDGSTDDSRDILKEFGESIRVVLKTNGGQTSALNYGYRVSKGRAVLFLDSDDLLLPEAIESSLSLMKDDQVALVHWPLLEVDESGMHLGQIRPTDPLPDGNLLEALLLHGPDAHVSSPTSGNLWSRTFLQHVFPLPEVDGYRLGGADRYLATLAPLFGRIRALREPLASYRLHGQNNYSAVAFEERFRRVLWCLEDRCAALATYCRDLGLHVDLESWQRASWVWRFAAARADIRRLIPVKDIIVLIDDDNLGSDFLPEYRLTPFTKREGRYWGPPADDDAALGDLERLRVAGARYVVFAWPAFWWFGHYARLTSLLRAHFPCLLENERVVVFDVGEPSDRQLPAAISCPHASTPSRPTRES
jgi:glycosyltransferase involved in cell wall biosynthesis